MRGHNASTVNEVHTSGMHERANDAVFQHCKINMS